MADPYADLDWEFHDIVIARPDGAPVFEQRGVEVPSSWSMNAATILGAQKFFRGVLGSPERESSLKQVIRRVVVAIAARRVADGNFVGDDQARIFTD